MRTLNFVRFILENNLSVLPDNILIIINAIKTIPVFFLFQTIAEMQSFEFGCYTLKDKRWDKIKKN